LDIKSKPLKKTILPILVGSILFTACRKEEYLIGPGLNPQAQALPLPCIEQTANPAGRSYDVDSVIDYSCTEKHCGMMPLSSKSYWVYEDSIFENGSFLRVQMDTLRYSSNAKSLSDGLVWWESTLYIGLPQTLYASDSSFFSMLPKLHNPEYLDAKKDYALFPGDSVKYLSSFDDIAAQGRSLRMNGIFETAAGNFENYIYFEKNARNYRKDRLYFKPGVGVMKYIREKAPMGSPQIKLEQIMTLVAFHIE
jgi:hypothetical protein